MNGATLRVNGHFGDDFQIPACAGMTMRCLPGIFLHWLLALSFAAVAGAAAAQPIRVTIAAINDLHGNLEAPTENVTFGGASVRAGGFARVATLAGRLRARSPNFAFVSAGDLFGASPLLPASFDEEPVIEAMNLAGLDFNGVGNHEFDRGAAHLGRMQKGGCPAAGCRSGAQFAGARFGMLAANVIALDTGRPLLPAYGIREYGRVKVAFIGVTLKETPVILSPAARAGLEFRDEVDTVNALVPELRRQGIEAIVVLLHQGGVTAGGANECVDPAGPVIDIARRLDRAVDVVVSAHTHRAYVCNIAGKLVTSAGSYGRFLTEIDLSIDPVSRDVVSAVAVNHFVSPDIPPDAAQAALLARYAALAQGLERVVGRLGASVSRRMNADGESPLGQLIADAQLAATASDGATVAFMNPGGIRASLEARDGAGISYAEVYSVYPFGNTLVTMTLTGAQILSLLERQWLGPEQSVLQVSRGFGYSWDPARPPGSRVVPDSVMIHGQPMRPDSAYRITVNSFLAGGGDGIYVLREGRDRSAGPDAREALVRYIAERSPVAPSGERRIRNVGRKE
jgi:5'-nucleotidase